METVLLHSFQSMARPTSSRSRRRPDPPVADDDLVARLKRMVAGAPNDQPLPTTRSLGEMFGVANTTVFRVLRNMALAGEIWQHPTNGRYYPKDARAVIDRPKPVACLFRRLELGSELYRELLEGVSTGCGEHRRTMLLWHDELLVNHPDPHEPPVFASIAQQRTILGDFLDRHGEAAGGFVLDHAWSDDALRSHSARLRPAVVLFRHCPLEEFNNVHADFRAGAFKSLAHLLGRGYEQIIPIEPFSGDLAVSEFNAALGTVADELACRNRLAPLALASTAKERATLIDRVRRGNKRAVLLCPEDNVALLLVEAAREAGLRCPERIGVLSVMGTDFATKAGLSCLRYDFRALGRLAVEALGGGRRVRHALEPQFVGGSTT